MTVFTVPVVRPTPWLSAPVVAEEAWPITPCFLGVVAGRFCSALGEVCLVPSGLVSFLGVFLIGVAFFGAVTGVFAWAGFFTVLDVVDVVFFTGVESLFAIFGDAVPTFLSFGLAAGVDFDTGRGFFVPMGVRVGAGFEAVLVGVLVAFTGVLVAGGETEGVDVVLDVADGSVFFVPIGVLADGVLAGVEVFAAGVEVPEVELIFAGVFLTGVAVDVVDLAVVVGVTFLTGVAVF